MSDAIETFFGAWSQPDADLRLKAIEAATTPATIYIDPRTSDPLSGPSAISDYVGMFVQMAPGAVAAVVDTQTQHSFSRATIAFRMKDGMEQMGQYFIESDDAGAITRMVGFVGTGAPA